ncbi:MAG: hypothetical protein ACLFR2_02165 [Candidatus Kapaibacterium sp.]
MKKLFILLIIISFVPACSPVRSYNSYDKTVKKDHAKQENQHDIDKPNPGAGRFSDTTIVLADPVYAQYLESSGNIDDVYKKALRQFDDKSYESACAAFSLLVSTLPQSDSLYYESAFYKSECRIMNDEMDKALELLLELAGNDLTPAAVLEKSLVRIGHIYCYKGKDETAQRYFKRLKKEFPASPYLELADCSKI